MCNDVYRSTKRVTECRVTVDLVPRFGRYPMQKILLPLERNVEWAKDGQRDTDIVGQQGNFVNQLFQLFHRVHVCLSWDSFFSLRSSCATSGICRCIYWTADQ